MNGKHPSKVTITENKHYVRWMVAGAGADVDTDFL
jgi:hypothetical protein